MSTKKSSRNSTVPSIVVRRPGQEDTIIEVGEYDCFSIRPPSIAIIRQSSGRSTRSHPASEHQELQCYIDPDHLPYIDVDEGSLFVKDTLTADELKLNPIGWSLNEPYPLRLQPSQILNVPQKTGPPLSFQCPTDGKLYGIETFLPCWNPTGPQVKALTGLPNSDRRAERQGGLQRPSYQS